MPRNIEEDDVFGDDWPAHLRGNTAEEALSSSYVRGVSKGRKDGIEIATNIVRRIAGELFSSGKDELARHVRELAKRIEQEAPNDA